MKSRLKHIALGDIVRQNWTLAQIRQGNPAIGLWLQTHSFHTARMIAAQGLFDWLLVDMEHTPVDLSTASMILSAIADISGGKCTPLVRVAQGNQYHIKQALDAGAQGIIVPMINTAQEAADLVRYARYPPIGERGAGGLIPHFGFGTTNHVEYVANANHEIMIAVQIETRASVENIESILAVPGIDLIFIGPFDLHISLGLPPALWSDLPVFQDAIHKVVSACKQRGMPYGTISPNAEGTKARMAEGYSFVSMGSDLFHMMATIHTQFQQLK